MASTLNLQEMHDSLHEQIDKIDEVLDSQVDQKTAGKRTIIKSLISDSEGSWKPVGEQLVNQLKTADTDLQIGIYYGLLRFLNDEFAKALAEAVDEKVKDIPNEPADKISEEELKTLSSVRSELYAKVKTIVDMAETFGMDASDFRMPKRRTGARGKRGPRAISAYSWDVEGTTYDKLKDVAELYDQYEKAADLTKAMREAKIDLKNPAERIEFTLPDGKILVGTKDPNKVATEDSDDDGDTETDDDGDDA